MPDTRRSPRPTTAVGFSRFLDQLGDTPLLSADDERDLAQRIEAGAAAAAALAAGRRSAELQRRVADGMAAREHFVRANLRLVVSIARKFSRPAGTHLDDLVQDGILGLDHAVTKFDWRRGLKFSTYATWWIRQAIQRGLEVHGTAVRIPAHRSSELRSALRALEGDPEQLDERLRHLQQLHHPDSLDRVVGPDDGAWSRADRLADEAAGPDELVLAGETSDHLHGLIETLDDGARDAIIARFGLDGSGPATFATVGRRLGISTEAARRRVQRALTTLRAALEPDDLVAA